MDDSGVVFATQESKHSNRPFLTISPFAETAGITVNENYPDKDYKNLAEHILSISAYDNPILICWHHGKILDLAEALGVNPAQLPASANWPKEWPEEVFGWVLQISYDESGNVNPNETLCFNEKLMFDDQLSPGIES